jgi:hypothetical protein
MATPELFFAPDTVAVYVVLPASELDGVNVATVPAPFRLTDPATGLPDASFTVNDTVSDATGWENVAVGAADTGTPVDPSLGVTPVTDGAALPADAEYTTSTQ